MLLLVYLLLKLEATSKSGIRCSDADGVHRRSIHLGCC